MHGLRLLLRLLRLPQLAAGGPQAHTLSIPTGGLMPVHVCIPCSLLLPPLWPGESHFLALGVHRGRQSQLADLVEIQPSLPMRGAQLACTPLGKERLLSEPGTQAASTESNTAAMPPAHLVQLCVAGMHWEAVPVSKLCCGLPLNTCQN